MPYFQKHLSCQGFGKHSANLFSLDDKIFWVAEYEDVFYIYMKIEDYTNIGDLSKGKLGARKQFLGSSNYGGFAVIPYMGFWAVVYCVDDCMKVSIFSSDFETEYDRKVICEDFGFRPLICYTNKSNVPGKYLIVYTKSDKFMYGFVTFDFLEFEPIELQRLKLYWNDYFLSGTVTYTFQHYLLVARNLVILEVFAELFKCTIPTSSLLTEVTLTENITHFECNLVVNSIVSEVDISQVRDLVNDIVLNSGFSWIIISQIRDLVVNMIGNSLIEVKLGELREFGADIISNSMLSEPKLGELRDFGSNIVTVSLLLNAELNYLILFDINTIATSLLSEIKMTEIRDIDTDITSNTLLLMIDVDIS